MYYWIALAGLFAALFVWAMWFRYSAVRAMDAQPQDQDDAVMIRYLKRENERLRAENEDNVREILAQTEWLNDLAMENTRLKAALCVSGKREDEIRRLLGVERVEVE